MGPKSKISANGTYVFDPSEIEELDELSLTSVLSAVVDPVTREQSETESPGTASPAGLGDTTINELLSGQLEPDDSSPGDFLSLKREPAETPDDLIDPELLFPELTSSKGAKRR